MARSAGARSSAGRFSPHCRSTALRYALRRARDPPPQGGWTPDACGSFATIALNDDNSPLPGGQHFPFPRRGAPGCRSIRDRPFEGRRSADRRPDAAAPGWAYLSRTPGACEAHLAPCGTRARRRSTLAICVRVRASVLGISSGDVQRAPRGRVVVPGGRLPHLPGLRLRAAAAGRQSRSAFGNASRKRPS